MDSPLSLLPDGPFTVAMAREVGIGRRALRGLVESQDVRRVLRGVYVRQSTPDSLALRARAACLVVSPAAVLCDRTAAWLHGIDVFWSAEHDYPSRLETFVLRGSTRLTRAETYGGQRDLASGGRHGDRWHARHDAAANRARPGLRPSATRRSGRTGLLHARLRHHQRAAEARGPPLLPTTRRSAAAQPDRAGRSASESPGESWTRLEILDSNLPAPQVQWGITRNGRRLFRLDLAYPGMKICVEYDGEEFHDSPEAREADEARRAWLRERGWIVIVVTKDDLTPDGVRRWTEELRRAVEARRVRIRLRPGRRTPQAILQPATCRLNRPQPAAQRSHNLRVNEEG